MHKIVSWPPHMFWVAHPCHQMKVQHYFVQIKVCLIPFLFGKQYLFYSRTSPQSTFPSICVFAYSQLMSPLHQGSHLTKPRCKPFPDATPVSDCAVCPRHSQRRGVSPQSGFIPSCCSTSLLSFLVFPFPNMSKSVLFPLGEWMLFIVKRNMLSYMWELQLHHTAWL